MTNTYHYYFHRTCHDMEVYISKRLSKWTVTLLHYLSTVSHSKLCLRLLNYFNFSSYLLHEILEKGIPFLGGKYENQMKVPSTSSPELLLSVQNYPF